ncbi:hypothetical protein Q4566_16425 [Tamlana sp. 2_MG-2023]|uniref:FKBP-type peptidyl-prolyl cis-trans isomerase n=1 Tax=unclassified Tamlana TaxID=2614803 RepID=UPI0026E1A392|nr:MULTISPECIES: hypothetical protein [unclassified Tamlana]MDO6761795.1 hypothetical protein [Tamlana sp. 2_MG-2023]MDO6792566.1 hypothetical protein [Tamlana sp. 1_MG-2023]
MKLIKLSLFVLGLATCFLSCKKDDDDDTVTVEIRDRTEQQAVDKALLLDYLETHYYNASEFDGSNPDPKSQDLVITALEDGDVVPTGHRLLIQDTITKYVNYADTDYEIYYLDLNKNVNPNSSSPHFSDNVVTNYTGFTLDNDIFDRSINGSFNTDLLNLVTAWGKVIPEFHTAESFNENADGTSNYVNHGVGVMFVPSGLGYFSVGSTSIPAYTCIAFAFDLLQMYENDHDSDGVASYLEDINEDEDFTYNSDTDVFDGDDTDGDGILDFVDTDDDGDGVLTIYEDIDGDGDPTNDIGKNGIPKYLDPEETEANYDVDTSL